MKNYQPLFRYLILFLAIFFSNKGIAQHRDIYNIGEYKFVQDDNSSNKYSIYLNKIYVGYYLIDKSDGNYFTLYNKDGESVLKRKFSEDNDIEYLKILEPNQNIAESNNNSDDLKDNENSTTKKNDAEKLVKREPTIQTKSKSITYEEVTLTEGTIVRVQLLNDISSRDIREGDVINFQVFEDIEIEGVLVIRKGTLVNAYVESAERSKALGKKGKFKLEFSSTRSVDGKKVNLRTGQGNVEGKSRLAGGIALAYFVNPLLVFIPGKNAKAFEGKVMIAYVSNNLTVKGIQNH